MHRGKDEAGGAEKILLAVNSELVIFQNMEEILKHRGRYVNPHVDDDKRSLWEFIRWKTGYYKGDGIPSHPPAGFAYPYKAQPLDLQRPVATWIGHSTFLVQVNGFNFLTDPVFDEYCSPVKFKGLKRYVKPSLEISDLPPLDVVLISHNHYDHLDEKTVRVLARLQPQTLWIVPRGLAKWFHKRGLSRCLELGWWESICLGGAKISAVPAQHFSGRGPLDKNKTLWSGYVVESGYKKAYFVGDTGYNSHDFKKIGFRFGSMDLSLIPIGSYIPRQFMSPVHSSPEDGVKIHQDVRSRFSLGMHWNTFNLSDEPINRPPYDLYLAMKAKNLPFDTFVPIDIGAWVNW